MEPDRRLVLMPPELLRANARNARRHPAAQIRQLSESIRRFGFNAPVLIGADNEIIAGHGRVEAAKVVGLKEVPTIQLSHLTEADRRAYVIADNKLALNATWDYELLAGELRELIDVDFDVTLTGFSLAEIDITLDAAKNSKPDAERGPEDHIPQFQLSAVSRPGDLWRIGRHQLICGDARRAEDYEQVLGGRLADLMFTDPPYNVQIDGHVSGLGRIRHREFAMGAGEMSRPEFTDFLRNTLGTAVRFCNNGTIAFVCMDWRHIGELVTASESVFSEMKNLCVWNKTNGGMGTFYRSKHELIGVFKVGDAPHTNTFGLGDTGRYRTNVWDYPGISSLGSRRGESLAMHPTVKPTALVADAIRDCSRRGQLILDPFAGSGTTLIAAQTCGRAAALIEYDPLYCDTIIRRFERFAGISAVLAPENEDFDAIALRRAKEADVNGVQ